MEAAQEKHRCYYAKYVIILLIVPNAVPDTYRHRDEILQWQRAHGVKKRDREAEAVSKEILRAVAKALHGCDDDDESESDTDNSSDDDETDTL
jgi:hypothetical protein